MEFEQKGVQRRRRRSPNARVVVTMMRLHRMRRAHRLRKQHPVIAAMCIVHTLISDHSQPPRVPIYSTQVQSVQ